MPMKKKKKGGKKAHHTNNMLALGKRADLIVSDAYRAGSIKGFYVQELLMQSEAAIRELESGLDWVQLHMFRAYMLKRVPSTKKETASAQSVTEYMMSQFYSTCQGVMMTAATSLLAEYFHKYLSELPSGADVLDATKNLLSRLPSKYFAPDVSGYSERMLDLLFTDPISLNLFATTEWDAVLPGANLIAWSRNVMELIKSFIDEDYQAYLEADRDKILNTVASIAAKEAGIVLDGVVSELRAIGADVPYIRDYGKPMTASAPLPHSNSQTAASARRYIRLLLPNLHCLLSSIPSYHSLRAIKPFGTCQISLTTCSIPSFSEQPFLRCRQPNSLPRIWRRYSTSILPLSLSQKTHPCKSATPNLAMVIWRNSSVPMRTSLCRPLWSSPCSGNARLKITDIRETKPLPFVDTLKESAT